jgi:hypothetical protein
VAIVEAFSREKDFAIDVLVWRNLNHRRAVRKSNVRPAHCLTSLRFVGSLRPRPSPEKEDRGRVRKGATRKPHAGDTGNQSLIVFWGANDQHACLTSCRRSANGFLRGVVPLVSAVTDFVAIAVHADEQCENRCGFVATQIAAVIRSRREIEIVSAEYCDYQKRFHFRTNSQHTIFAGFSCEYPAVYQPFIAR